ncbi:hypothetical protein Salat_0385300 [Sesamum alatum]|uniref:Uncharacterized protein n=1 Tax=Sesamum alatum TaxID=300844 RepID=A0AAE1Z1P0_9LAMI|nr:hypothetical protein Salat_0385300 [Sesamum alatum]
MGGESSYPLLYSTEDESSSLAPKFPLASITSSVFSGNEKGFSHKSENCSAINGESGLNFGEFQDEGPRLSLISEATERQRVKVYAEVLRSYEELQSRIDRLEEAKSRILSYTPGAWAEKIDGMDLREYDIPNITSLLLIGPKGSGKSSLINKISRVLENDIFLSGRAQVSWNSSTEDGTYFLHEYVIPRGSGSFCLYDTRSLSDDCSENRKMLARWMLKGVRHGELVKRKSDSKDLKARLKCKAWRSRPSSQVRDINFVIFVVNGLSVLESMDRVDGKKKEYSQMIATNFNNPLLSFKDDKPIVVITHGDLLSLSDRVRIRVYLGELLGVPPTRQIFDIPESNDSATELAIVDMLIYCLERADRNLPPKNLFVGEVPSFRCMLLCIVLAMAVVVHVYRLHAHQPRAPIAPSPTDVDWHRIRHLWLG